MKIKYFQCSYLNDTHKFVSLINFLMFNIIFVMCVIISVVLMIIFLVSFVFVVNGLGE